jgi:beta-lactamase superfamily II metal-dependent hydrolase
MTCEITFLPVGNADSIIVKPENGAAVIIDLPDLPLLRKWFDRKQENRISRIYVTHAHRDHFAPFNELVNFLEGWLARGGVIETICLPRDAIKNAQQQIKANRGKNAYYKDLEDALPKLKALRSRGIRFLSMNRGDNPYCEGDLEIHTLHPESTFLEHHLASNNGKHNETSLVQRVTYGKFAALLLADLEGAGLTDLLEVTEQSPTELKAQVAKIPHHGGYPKNGNELKTLLEKIDPEIAILSVGSTNRYGHVVPDLFGLLVNLKNDQSKQLRQFICTEVTKTCACSAAERSVMKKNQGLSSRKLCAGEITIVAETSGKFTVKTETNHSQEIAQISYAACDGRADL